MPTIVAIAGMTGKFARCITDHLLEHDDVHIHGLCRSPAKMAEEIRSHPRVTIFQASSDEIEAIRKGIHGAAIVICCYLGDDKLMIDGQKTLIDASIAERVPRYLAGDYSLDFRPLQLGDLPPKDPMKHVQAYLEERADQVQAVHVLNGAFMESYFSFAGAWDPASESFRYWGTGDEIIELTTYDDTAAFVAKVARDATAHGWLNFLGDRISVKGMARAFEEVYHVKPTMVNLGTVDEMYQTMQATFKASPKNPYAWMGLFYGYWMTKGTTKLAADLDNKRYPKVQPLTVKQFMSKHTIKEMGTSAQF